MKEEFLILRGPQEAHRKPPKKPPKSSQTNATSLKRRLKFDKKQDQFLLIVFIGFDNLWKLQSSKVYVFALLFQWFLKITVFKLMRILDPFWLPNWHHLGSKQRWEFYPICIQNTFYFLQLF